MINFFKYLYLNVVFYSGLLLFTMLGTPLMAVCLLPFALIRSHLRGMELFRRAIYWYGKVIIFFAWPLVRMRCRSLETSDFVPSIIICNHRSASDAFLMANLPSIGIDPNTVQIVNIWPFRIPILGIGARAAGYLSINETSFEEFTARAVKLLNNGVSIISFPEGTRSGKREMGPFHSGIFRLALETGVPIIPCCISGNENIPHKGSLLLHPGIITIIRMPTIQPKDYQDMTAIQLKAHIRCSMEAMLLKMDEGKMDV